jgi:hypothetical protein
VSDTWRPERLTWADVDPAAHPFAPDAATAAIRRLLPTRGGWPERWTDSVTAVLVDLYGSWVCGWRWAHGEGEIGGGPVGAWCCPQHSMTTPQATAQRVHAAVLEWRGWLEELAGMFARLAPPKGADKPAKRDAWERAAVQLVTAVADRTGAGDAWYIHCEQVLGWYLVSCGLPEKSAHARVRKAVKGAFASWIEPNEQTVQGIGRLMAGTDTPAGGTR